MSVIERVREALDAPRFCRDCGQAVKVENVPSFDERTGEARDRWLWRCPRTSVTFGGGRVIAESSGDFVHQWGRGRPRWHVSGSVDEEGGDG